MGKVWKMERRGHAYPSVCYFCLLASAIDSAAPPSSHARKVEGADSQGEGGEGPSLSRSWPSWCISTHLLHAIVLSSRHSRRAGGLSRFVDLQTGRLMGGQMAGVVAVHFCPTFRRPSNGPFHPQAPPPPPPFSLALPYHILSTHSLLHFPLLCSHFTTAYLYVHAI